MGNPQHLEWLLEGAESWNKRRKEQPFTSDLSELNVRRAFIDKGIIEEGQRIPLERADLFEADLRQADLREADLEGAYLVGADLRRADLEGAYLEGAYLVGADLRRADLEGAYLEGADLEGAKVTTIVYSGVGTNDESTPEYTNLSQVRNLSQRQLYTMIGDTGTILPDNLTRPTDWPDWRDQLKKQAPAGPDIPDAPVSGDEVTITNSKITLAGSNAPDRADLETLFDDLLEDVAAFHRSANLGNLSPTFAAALDRFLDTLPDVFQDLDQTRFGVQSTNMRLRFTSSKAEIEEIAPERIGFVEAILFSSELLADRLPRWAEFLSETDPEVEVVEANSETVSEALGSASTQIANAPDTYDEALAERVKEYIDTATIHGYIAAEHILFNTLHATLVALKRHNDDVGEELYKLHTKATAKIIYATIGDAAATLAGLQPTQFAWVKTGLEWLAKIVAGA